MRVHISKKKGGAVQAKLVEETNGGRGDRIPYPFVLEPRGQIAYFDAREQVNLVAMVIVRSFTPSLPCSAAAGAAAAAPGPPAPLLLRGGGDGGGCRRSSSWRAPQPLQLVC